MDKNETLPFTVSGTTAYTPVMSFPGNRIKNKNYSSPYGIYSFWHNGNWSDTRSYSTGWNTSAGTDQAVNSWSGDIDFAHGHTLTSTDSETRPLDFTIKVWKRTV